MPPLADPPRFARFRLLRELGGGAQGTVHEAIDLERDTHVALKTLRHLGPDEIVRLKTEFRAVRDLRHPNLVKLGELIEDEGRWFFTMETIDGVDFLSYVRGEAVRDESTSWPTRVDTNLRGRAPSGVASGEHIRAALPATFDEARLRAAFAELASALAFLHRAGKVHRDLKPSNVMVERGGRVVVIDFGVVAEFASHEAGGAMVGTVPYMAPEQVLGEAVGPAADWYAAGVLLFESLTGRRPFDGDANDVMERKCLLEPPRASEVVADLPADLDALVARMLARDPSERATDAEVLVALGLGETGARALPARVAFVGRKRELAVLGDAFADLRHGALVSVFIEGESGIGKSALARHFVEDLARADRHVVVLDGRCHEQERVPYNAFDAVIDALARYLRARSPKRREQWVPPGMDRLRRLFPSLGVIDDGPPPTSGVVVASRDERREAFAVLRELFARVGRSRSLVLLIEDIQWADADSLALLEALSEGPGTPCLLLLATSRARDDGTPCEAMRALRGDVRRLPLAGLGEDDVQDLVVRLTGGRGASPGLASSTFAADSHGHPLFIEEMVRYMEGAGGHPAAVALDEALAARAGRLDDGTRRVLQVIAAAESPTAQSTIAAAAGIPFSDYVTRSRLLREAKLVQVRGERPEDPVEPYHDRVREAVYRALSVSARASLHGALGLALEARGASAELLARHFDVANDEPRTARYAQIAARAAARAMAFDRAADLYERALVRFRGPPDQRRHLVTALAESQADAGRSKAAGESFLEAARTGEPTADQRNDLLRRAAELLLASGNLVEGLEATRVVLRHNGLSLPTSRVAGLARLAWYQLRTDLSDLTWDVRRPEQVPPAVASRLDLSWSIGGALGLIDSIRSMLFLLSGAVDAIAHGDEARIARALAAASTGQAGVGRRTAATRLANACRRAAESEGSDRSLFFSALATFGIRFFLDNDWPGCLAETLEATRLWRTSGRTDGWEADLVDQFACWSLDNMGRLRALEDRVPAKIRAAQRAGNRFIEVNYRTQFVNLALAADRPDEARRDVQDAIASWPRVDASFGNQDYLAVRNLTYVALYAGDVEATVGLQPEWHRYFGSLLARVKFLRQDALTWLGTAALARAARHKTLDGPAKGELREARRALRALNAIDLPMAVDGAGILRAGIASLEGEEDVARESLRSAIARADARAADLHGACLRARLGDAVGGDEGRGLKAQSAAWMAAQGVRAPERLVQAILPVRG